MKRLISALAVSTLVAFSAFDCATGRADVVVYKESCGHYAFEDWHLSCKILKNSFDGADRGRDFWADPFRDIESITVCASFHNRGGLNVPATVVYNYKKGEQTMPTKFFDTVKFKGSLLNDTVSWIGTGSRLLSTSWRMRGELRRSGRDSFTYAEELSNGQSLLGQIRTQCSYLNEDK